MKLPARLFFVFVILLTFSNAKAQEFEELKFRSLKKIELGIAVGRSFKDEQIGNNVYRLKNEKLRNFSLIYIQEWPISQRIYVGLGTGYTRIVIGERSKYETGFLDQNGDYNVYVQWINTPRRVYQILPIFAQTTFYFRKEVKSSFVTANLGSFVKLDKQEGNSSLIKGLGVGQRYRAGYGNLLSWSINFDTFFFTTRFENPTKMDCTSLKIGFNFL